MGDERGVEQQEIPDWLRQLRAKDFPDEVDHPIVLEGPIEVMNNLVDNAEPLRIMLYDDQGVEIAEVVGIIDQPQRREPEGEEPHAEFKLSRNGVDVVVRIPLDPGTFCVMYPGGLIRGMLPNGVSWSINSALPDPFERTRS